MTAAVAAPLLTLCSARLERRTVLVGLSVLVLVSDVIAGLAPGFGVMLAARAVLGIGVGGFWVFGAGAAISLVSERARGTAVAVVSSGIFLATVASLPAASLIGTLTTWRAAFAIAAVFAVIAVAAQLAAVPHLGAGGRVRPRSLLTVVTRPVSRIGLVAAGAFFFANFAAYTYIGPLLHARAGLGPGAITLVLLGFGLAGAAGNFAAGVTVRGHLRATLMGSGLLIAVSALLLAAVTGARPLIIALVAVWGLGFGAVPVAAQSWMVRAMPANIEGGLALFVSALQGSLPPARRRRRDLRRQGTGRRARAGRRVAAAGHWPCWAGPARPSALRQQALPVWPARGARRCRRRRTARPIAQETARNEHAEVAVRGHTQAATTRKELPCPTRL